MKFENKEKESLEGMVWEDYNSGLTSPGIIIVTEENNIIAIDTSYRECQIGQAEPGWHVHALQGYPAGIIIAQHNTNIWRVNAIPLNQGAYLLNEKFLHENPDTHSIDPTGEYGEYCIAQNETCPYKIFTQGISQQLTSHAVEIIGLDKKRSIINLKREPVMDWCMTNKGVLEYTTINERMVLALHGLDCSESEIKTNYYGKLKPLQDGFACENEKGSVFALKFNDSAAKISGIGRDWKTFSNGFAQHQSGAFHLFTIKEFGKPTKTIMKKGEIKNWGVYG